MKNKNKGFTLIELLISVAIISILASVTIPVSRISIKKTKEYELKNNLRIIREAIDKFKDDFDSVPKEEKYSSKDPFKDIREITSTGYPKSLEELKTYKYLRKILNDPMTKETHSNKNGNWNTRSSTDQNIQEKTNGEDIYDIFSKSNEKSINETDYKEW